MQRMRLELRAVSLAMMLSTSVLAASFTSVAKAPPVKVGKISTEAKASPAIKQEIKTAIEQEIAGMDLSSARGQYVLTASLITLETKTQPDRVESTCIINAELAQQKGGRLEAVFRGKARAVDAKNAAKAAELAALKGAVRSAVKRLPEAVH